MKKKNIFSAYRKPNIGLEARNGEGKKKKPQSKQQREEIPTKQAFFSFFGSQVQSLQGELRRM